MHPKYGIYASNETVSFTREGGQVQLWVSTCDTVDSPWTATASDNWISVAGTGFDHLGQITISAAENNIGSERIGTISFVQGNLMSTLNVVQSAYNPVIDYCPLTIYMENIFFCLHRRRLDYSSTTSMIIIRTNPTAKPMVDRLVWRPWAVSGMSSSTTTYIMAPAAKASK